MVVHEAQSGVGHRFRRGLQGLENWSDSRNVLDALNDVGITTDFTKWPARDGMVFDAWGEPYPVHSDAPLFYLLERGPGPGTLDTALLNQAVEAGVEVRFNRPVRHIEGAGIVGTGPKSAIGYHFDTRSPNGFWAICDDQLAPQGYAYLLALEGKGTLKTCLFTGFKDEALYLKRTVEAFQRLVDVEIVNPVEHGGAGNFRIPQSAKSGRHPIVGEQAGFQDPLWGFGIRPAITSGVLAARSILEGVSYDLLWRQGIAAGMECAVVNRALYGLLGNRGYRWILRHRALGKDARTTLHAHCRPSIVERLLAPIGHWRYRSSRHDTACNHIDCNCVWCRHCYTQDLHNAGAGSRAQSQRDAFGLDE